MSEFTMGLEDLKEDLEGNQWKLGEDGETVLIDEEGQVIEEPVLVSDGESELQELDSLMALEALLSTDGLVSRTAMEPVQQYLPSHIPVQSFTNIPTRVNHGVALESVTGAIHLVASAGVIALLGGIGFLLYKMSKKKKLMPKTELDRKITAAYTSIEEKLKVALQELNNMHPNIKHPAMNWSRQDSTVHMATNRGVNEVSAMILGGKYPFMSDRLYAASADQGKKVCDFIENNMLKQIQELEKRGSEDDLTELETTLNNFKVPDHAHKEIVDYCKTLGLTIGEEDSPSTVWKDHFTKALERESVKEKIGNIQPNHKPMGEGGIKKLVAVQERIASVNAKFTKIMKSLEGQESQVSGNYARKLKELTGRVKELLSSVSDGFTISDAEVQAFNTCAMIKADVVGDGFNFLRTQYLDFSKTDKDNAKAYKECIAHLTELFSSIKSAIK